VGGELLRLEMGESPKKNLRNEEKSFNKIKKKRGAVQKAQRRGKISRGKKDIRGSLLLTAKSLEINETPSPKRTRKAFFARRLAGKGVMTCEKKAPTNAPAYLEKRGGLSTEKECRGSCPREPIMFFPKKGGWNILARTLKVF